MRKQVFTIGEYYHLYNRGVEKRFIFKDKKDHEHFLFLMYICNSEKSIVLRDIGKNFDRGETILAIGAYCLMPNHFHMLVREKIEGGISKYMRKLMTAYSMYFNKKYNRTGKLYEGVFKATHCGTDRYLKYLYSYIHLNPAKLVDSGWRKNHNKNTKLLLEYVFSFAHSSLHEYLDGQYRVVEPGVFPGYFQKPYEHKKELFDWLTLTP